MDAKIIKKDAVAKLSIEDIQGSLSNNDYIIVCDSNEVEHIVNVEAFKQWVISQELLEFTIDNHCPVNGHQQNTGTNTWQQYILYSDWNTKCQHLAQFLITKNN